MARVIFHIIPEFKSFLWDPLTLIVWSKFSLNKWLCLCNDHPSFIDNRQFLTQLNPALWTPHYYRINFFLSLEKASPHIFSIFNSLNTDTPLKRTLLMVPSVSLFTGFTCISISWNIFNQVLVLPFIIQSNAPVLQDHQTRLHLWFLLSQMTTHHHPQLHIYRLLEPGEKVLNN